MSGNIKTINRSNQKNNIIFEKWHEQNHGSCHNEQHKFHIDDKRKFLLLGTPNVGKSTFFNKITTATAMVSNIDRMTVQNTVGRFRNDKSYCLVDLPGVYNLSHPLDEEMVVAHEIFHENFLKIANIVGAQSIERDLILTIQCLETGMLSTVMVNMIDEINKNAIDYKKMSKMLNNVTIIPTQANRWRGINEASHSIINDAAVNEKLITYPVRVEQLINKIINVLPNMLLSKRFIALMILERNTFLIDELEHHYPEHLKKINKIIGKTNDFYNVINESRMQFIKKIARACFIAKEQYHKNNNTQIHKLDHVLLNKWIGIPLFLIMIALIYFISFGPWTGGWLQSAFYDDFLIKIVNNKGIRALFDLMNSPLWVTNLFVDGVFGGLFAVLSFIPVIAILFIFVNIINQVGIISRVSVLLDQTFERFGISGRSIVNLLTGFGCNVPAIMMSRSSSSKKERIISILIAPFIACSARIIVFSFICNMIFGSTTGWIGMIGLTLGSGLIALFVGLFFSKTMFRKVKSFFLIEMVNWRKPDFHVIAKSVWLELKEFIKKATLLILIANLLIWLMLHIYIWHAVTEWNGLIALDNQGLDQSLMYYIGQGIKYLFYPVGFYGDNDWKLTVSLLSAIPAKEIVIANFHMLWPSWNQGMPSPINIAQGLSYLIMIMAFFPCSATFSILHKEGGWKILRNHLLIAVSSTYMLAIVVYWISFSLVG